MKPIASSATAGTKPGEARVTSTPTSDAAATSMLRISTAQRTMARSFGSCGKISPLPSVTRSATMMSTSCAAATSPAASSASSPSCSLTSAMRLQAVQARSP